MKELAGDEMPVQMDMSSVNILSAGKKRVGVARCVRRCYSMRSKARGLAQHVGLPGWLEESVFVL
jgi:hypothetical protein